MHRSIEWNNKILQFILYYFYFFFYCSILYCNKYQRKFNHTLQWLPYTSDFISRKIYSRQNIKIIEAKTWVKERFSFFVLQGKESDWNRYMALVSVVPLIMNHYENGIFFLLPRISCEYNAYRTKNTYKMLNNALLSK